MFSGIIETVGIVEKIEIAGENLNITIGSEIAKDCYIDQSISHNGVCLTVVAKTDRNHTVTAVKETLDISNLSSLKLGSLVNLETSVKMDSALDGHIVQGHVDATAKCTDIQNLDGSWYYAFEYDPKYAKLIVSKGSIAVNGVSLTVVEPNDSKFKVAIIPYTHEHTNFKTIEVGDRVNIEFDIIGKYVQKHLEKINLG